MSFRKGAPGKITADIRRTRALEMRQRGMPYAAIGKELGITPDGAYKAVMRALRLLHDETKEKTSQYVTLEISRLDRLFDIAFNFSLGGDINAMDRCLKITETRSKLLGLYAPTKTIIDLDVRNLTYEQLELLASGKPISSNPTE